MSFDHHLETISAGHDLSRSGAEAFLGHMLENDLPATSIEQALLALSRKATSVDEVCGFVDSMRTHALDGEIAHSHAIDTCGTGGDKAGTFNISTTAAIVVAASGVQVAKHGGRAVSGSCGSADVLKALGIPTTLLPDGASESLLKHNFAFLWSRLYYPALGRLAVVRNKLGVSTIFNDFGPLLNPAHVKRQVIGTSSLKTAQLFAEAASQLDYEHALVLASGDGMDEASLGARVRAFEIRGESVTPFSFKAQDFGLEPAPKSELKGGNATDNAAIMEEVVQPSTGRMSSRQRAVVLNAGLALYVADTSETISDGIELARSILHDGGAAAKLGELQSAYDESTS